MNFKGARTVLKLKLWHDYLRQRADFAKLLTLKKCHAGEIDNEDFLNQCFKKMATEKMSYLYQCKGVEMEPTIYAEEILCVRKFPYLNVKLRRPQENIRVGDVVVLKDPLNSDNHVVRRLAAVGGYEMASVDKEDESFVLEDDQCWVLSDSISLKPGESNDSRTYGPISITDIVGRAMFRFRTSDHNGFVPNNKISMKNDMSVMFVELDSGELLHQIDKESKGSQT